MRLRARESEWLRASDAISMVSYLLVEPSCALAISIHKTQCPLCITLWSWLVIVMGGHMWSITPPTTHTPCRALLHSSKPSCSAQHHSKTWLHRAPSGLKKGDPPSVVILQDSNEKWEYKPTGVKLTLFIINIHVMSSRKYRFHHSKNVHIPFNLTVCHYIVRAYCMTAFAALYTSCSLPNRHMKIRWKLINRVLCLWMNVRK